MPEDDKFLGMIEGKVGWFYPLPGMNGDTPPVAGTFLMVGQDGKPTWKNPFEEIGTIEEVVELLKELKG